MKKEYKIMLASGKEQDLDLSNKKEVKEMLEALGDKELRDYVISEELGEGDMKKPPSVEIMKQQ